MTTARIIKKRARPARPQAVASDGSLATILICNHNYERYVRAAVESALSQTYRPLEVIVVDDGSTDGSRALLSAYDGRVKLILKRNGGQPSALNAGFRESRGEYIFLLDADDEFDRMKVTRIVQVFERNPDAGWIFHELDYVDSDGRVVPLDVLPDREDVRSIRRRRARYPNFAHIDLRRCFSAGDKLPYTCPAFSALAFRRSTLEAILPMPEDIARASDEYPKIAAIALFRGIHLGEAMAHQRVHATNAASFRENAHVEAATRYVKTAYYLRHRFEHIGPSTDKWFASSFGRLVGVVGAKAAFASEENRRYLKSYFKPLTWVRQGPRIAFHAARARLERLSTHDGATRG